MKSFMRIGLAYLFVAQLSSIGFAQFGIITTYAGPQLPVNGSLAVSQAIDGLASVASDGAGGFYVASSYQHRVYRVSADGRLSLVAGKGTYGFSGDGGLATSAQLASPWGIALDTSGNLFIADQENHRVRKVTPGGIISTVAGNGTSGLSGDGGPATSAQIASPQGVALDMAGNLFIADYGNFRVRKVTPSGIISTVAGNGINGFSGDGGPPTSAQLNRPIGLALDGDGNLFIADTVNNRVRKLTAKVSCAPFSTHQITDFNDDGRADIFWRNMIVENLAPALEKGRSLQLFAERKESIEKFAADLAGFVPSRIQRSPQNATRWGGGLERETEIGSVAGQSDRFPCEEAFSG